LEEFTQKEKKFIEEREKLKKELSNLQSLDKPAQEAFFTGMIKKLKDQYKELENKQ